MNIKRLLQIYLKYIERMDFPKLFFFFDLLVNSKISRRVWSSFRLTFFLFLTFLHENGFPHEKRFFVNVRTSGLNVRLFCPCWQKDERATAPRGSACGAQTPEGRNYEKRRVWYVAPDRHGRASGGHILDA